MKKRGWKRLQTGILCAALLLSQANMAFAADAQHFEAPQYNSSFQTDAGDPLQTVLQAVSGGNAGVVSGGDAQEDRDDALSAVPALHSEEMTDDNILFWDDFEGGELGEDWIVESSAVAALVDDGTGNHRVSLRPRDGEWGSSINLYPNRAEWKNYSVEVSFEIEEWTDTRGGMSTWDNIGVAGRYGTDPEQRWEIMYRRESGKLELNKFSDNSGHEISTLPYDIQAGVTYSMKIEFDGSVIRAYFALEGEEYGDAIFEYKDQGYNGSFVDYGGIKISSCGALTYFDDVKVTAKPVEPDEEPEPVERELLFEDDFENGFKEEWLVESSAEAEIVDDGTGNHRMSIRPKDNAWGSSINLNPGKTEWRNYSVEMDFELAEWIDTGNGMRPWDNIGVAGRWSMAPEQRWEIMYRRESGKLELNKFINNGGNAIKTIPYTIEAGVQYSMKIDFDGSTVRAYFAEAGEPYGEPVFEYEDAGAYGNPIDYGGIKISSCGAHTYFDNIKVIGIEQEYPAESVTVNRTQAELEAGEQESLSAYVLPLEASNRAVTWTSSDESVASVSDQGLVSAIAAGEAVITAISAYSDEVKAECKVTVLKAPVCETFYYIAPAGSDENDGSLNAPFASLEKARDTIRSMETLPDGGVTVYLRDGIYYRDETFVLTPEDSGEKGKPIVYASYPGETAVITGAELITGWKLAEDDTPMLSEEAKGKVYVADVEQGWKFHDLYVDGERQSISSSMDDLHWRNWPTVNYTPTTPGGQTIIFQDGVLDGLGGKEIEINLMSAWWWNCLPVLKDINENTNTAVLHTKNASYPNGCFLAGNYSILNALKYLDIPGEWCMDSQEGKVYYWPEEGVDLEKAETVAPHLYELIRLQGDEEEEGWNRQVEYITLDRLVMEYNDRMPEDQWPDEWLVRNSENPDAAVYLQGVKECKITNCVIRHTGSYAINLDHWAQENVITGNELGDLGSGGIQMLGYGVGTTDVNHDNRIMFNYIYDIGRAPYSHSAGITIFGSGYNTMAYNHFVNMPYAAVAIMGTDAASMSASTPLSSVFYDSYGNDTRHYQIRFDELGGKDFDRWSAHDYQHSEYNVIQYNICDTFTTQMEDGGALYIWSSGLYNEFSRNLLNSQSENCKGFALYADDYVDYCKFESNVALGARTDFFDNSHGSTISNINYQVVNSAESEAYTSLKNAILSSVSGAGYSFVKGAETVYSVDKDALRQLAEDAEAVDGQLYTEESAAALQQALDAAMAVIGDSRTTQEEIEKAYSELKAAFDALVKADNDDSGNTGDGDTGNNGGNTGDGDTGNNNGNTGDGDTGNNGGNTGDGDTGDNNGSTGDGDTGNNGGNTGDGDTGNNGGNTGDGDTSNNGGNTGDGDTGNNGGSIGDGDTGNNSGSAGDSNAGSGDNTGDSSDPGNAEVQTPATGDTQNVMIFILIAVLGIATILLVRRKVRA